MKIKFKLVYNDETGILNLKLPRNWKKVPTVQRLDALLDSMALLEQIYDSNLKEYKSAFKTKSTAVFMLEQLGHSNIEVH